ncbi:MAG: hypothetical protein M3Q56_11030 [Bacteroidota bacterium]|nr:hypothetical protein [Bacteroidota bacterium]
MNFSENSSMEWKDPCCKTNKTTNSSNSFSCKLTSAELQLRKSTVLESLRKQILETKELDNGYAFKFNGSDKMIDEITEFVKTERQCCDFFTFTMAITGDTSSIWFEITGAPEAKDFIKTELSL